ncbi:hypothetical protein HAX54_043964 [Datura stramonium]|uniref:Uncharacterized protein n=1 Tax=Datura stramonium TaxID=4076 RepID=A0ABS8W410_DATST|nr:hypothetical protein [Datura stramonium]
MPQPYIKWSNERFEIDGVGDTRRTAKLLRNNVDPSPHPLQGSCRKLEVSVELGHQDNPIVIEASARRTSGHRDDPIVIEVNEFIDTESSNIQDDEEVEHENALR